MSKISVVINTYNAEKFLRQVLDSVQGFDEVLLCDMESTDRTLDIARQYGCKIVVFPKGDITIVEPARQFALNAATNPWVLVIDADELVTPALRDYLYRFIQEKRGEGLWIPRKNYYMGHFMHCHYPDYLLRFFIKEGAQWPPFVHAVPQVQGRLLRIPQHRQDLALIHLANDSTAAIVQKINQYTEKEVEKKAHKNYGWGALLFRPFFRFFKAYVLKGGFRDGKAGFLRASLDACYQITMLAKIIEKREGKELV